MYGITIAELELILKVTFTVFGFDKVVSFALSLFRRFSFACLCLFGGQFDVNLLLRFFPFCYSWVADPGRDKSFSLGFILRKIPGEKKNYEIG